ncbi:MAG: hypothetical protein GTO14_15290 [Anaerolineales bacterium]|nr:hypothetical protein [Anaerolineales bacterium]
MVAQKKPVTNRNSIAIVAIFVLLSILACQFDLGGPAPPGEPISTQPEAAQTLIQMWQAAIIDAATTGRVLVLLNETQLTSLLAQRMEANENPALLEPQVFLRHDAIQIYGITERGAFKASILLGITPVIDAEGELTLDLTIADFGPIPAPSALKDTVSAILTEAFTGTIGPLATGIRLTTIAISDGEMAIVGELR